MANVFDQFDPPSATVGVPQGIGQFGPGTKYSPAQMAQLNAARADLRAAEARGDPRTYGAIDPSQVVWDDAPIDPSTVQWDPTPNPFDQFDPPQGARTATYEVTGPDGSCYHVTAPSNATPDQIIQYAQSQTGAKTAPALTAPVWPGANDAQMMRRQLGAAAPFSFGSYGPDIAMGRPVAGDPISNLAA